MAHVLIDPTTVVDDETGEIIGTDRDAGLLEWLAAQLLDATQQAKVWKAREAALKAVFMRQQTAKNENYAGIVVSIRQATRKTQDTDGLKAEIRRRTLAAEGLTIEQLTEQLALTRSFALAAKEYDLTQLPFELNRELLSYEFGKLAAPYVIAEPARKPAPKAQAGQPKLAASEAA